MKINYGVSEADPEFFFGGGAPLMNYVTDRWCKQMLQNSSYIRTSQTISGGGGAHPLHHPPRSAPGAW